jgi:hypothetical protein
VINRKFGSTNPNHRIAVKRYVRFTPNTVKDRIPTEGGEQEVLLINEPNVYRFSK